MSTRRMPGLPVFLLAAVLVPGGAALAGPAIQHWTTDDGARVYFVPAHELPIVDVKVVFDAGSARDGDSPGLACLTNALLDQGAGGMDADGVARGLAEVGARIGNACARDMATVTLRSLSDPEYLRPALSVFSAVLREPTLAEQDFERTRARTLVALRSQQQDPGDVVKKAFYRALYADHPYATPSLGEEASLKAVTREQVADFYRRYYLARNAVIALVGDLTREQAEALAAGLVSCPSACRPAAPLPAPRPLAAAREVDVDYPSAQSHVRMGALGIRRGDPDYFPLYVGNDVLGGSSLISRLGEEVREKRGLSYSVYSYFSLQRVEGPFLLGLQTRNEQRGRALAVARETLARYVTEGPTEEELADAKKKITGGFPLRLDSNKKVLGYLATIGFYGLPLDYLDTFTDKVEAVTREQVQDAFRRHLDPQRMLTVVVGGSAPASGGAVP